MDAQQPPWSPARQRRIGNAGAAIVLFDLQVFDSDEWVVVAPVGELDLSSIPQVRQRIVQLVADGEQRVVLDLAGVDFVDSAGIGLVVMVAKRLAAHGGELRIAGPTQGVWSVFELVGLDRLWPAHESVADAIAGRTATTMVPDAERAPQ
ncbi:MAG: STAS domain-containing protein [Acidimicrobiia bacterium]|nr:STAS domain-containing protein [Acidimicrobiia bacterium]